MGGRRHLCVSAKGEWFATASQKNPHIASGRPQGHNLLGHTTSTSMSPLGRAVRAFDIPRRWRRHSNHVPGARTAVRHRTPQSRSRATSRQPPTSAHRPRRRLRQPDTARQRPPAPHQHRPGPRTNPRSHARPGPRRRNHRRRHRRADPPTSPSTPPGTINPAASPADAHEKALNPQRGFRAIRMSCNIARSR